MKLHGFSLIQMSILLVIAGSIIVIAAKMSSHYAVTAYQIGVRDYVHKELIVRLRQYAKIYRTMPGSDKDSRALSPRFDETLKPIFERYNIFYRSAFNDKVGEICDTKDGITLHYCDTDITSNTKSCAEKDIVRTISGLAYLIVFPGKDKHTLTLSPDNADHIFLFPAVEYAADNPKVTFDDAVVYLSLDEAREIAECALFQKEPPAVGDTLPRIRRNQIAKDYGNTGYFTKLPVAFNGAFPNDVRCCIATDFPGEIKSSCAIGVCDQQAFYQTVKKDDLFIGIEIAEINSVAVGGYQFVLHLLAGSEKNERTTVKTISLLIVD